MLPLLYSQLWATFYEIPSPGATFSQKHPFFRDFHTRANFGKLFPEIPTSEATFFLTNDKRDSWTGSEHLKSKYTKHSNSRTSQFKEKCKKASDTGRWNERNEMFERVSQEFQNLDAILWFNAWSLRSTPRAWDSRLPLRCRIAIKRLILTLFVPTNKKREGDRKGRGKFPVGDFLAAIPKSSITLSLNQNQICSCPPPHSRRGKAYSLNWWENRAFSRNSNSL